MGARAALPAQARRRDQLGRPREHAVSATLSALRRRRADPAELARARSARCGAATCARCCASSSRCTRGRGRSACSRASSATATAAAATSWPGSAARVVGYAGLLLQPSTTATSPTSPSTPPGTAHKIGTRLLLTLARQARAGGRQEPHPRGAGQQPRRPGACTGVRLRARRDPQGVLRERRGRHRHVGPRHRRARVRRPPRTPSRRPCPGTTSWEGLA